MSELKEYQAKTRQEAVRMACQEMLVEPRRLQYEVLEERETKPSRFKKGTSVCRIRVTGVKSMEEVREERAVEAEGRQASGEERPRREGREERGRERDRGGRGGRGGRGRGERGRGGRSRDDSPRRERRSRVPNPDVDSLEVARQFIGSTLERMGFAFELDAEEDESRVRINIRCEDEALDSEQDGRVVESLGYLAHIIVYYNKGGKAVSVDHGDRQKKRLDTLCENAIELAQKAIESGEPIKLHPMNSAERRLVHTTLADVEGVTTRSEGDGAFRRLLIVPESAE